MDQTTATNGPLRPTRRQCWIFAIYTLTTIGVTASAPAVKQQMEGFNVLPIVLVFSPWLLGVLVIVFDKSGPLRNWMAPLLLSLFYPVVALWYDVVATFDWVRLGRPPAWPFTAVVNVVFLGGFAAYLYSMYPRRCPACSQRALIPLLRLGKQEQRTRKTRWCASCGAKLWRDDQGQWQPERRRTWLDAPAQPENTTAHQAHVPAPRSRDEVHAGSAETSCNAHT